MLCTDYVQIEQEDMPFLAPIFVWIRKQRCNLIFFIVKKNNIFTSRLLEETLGILEIPSVQTLVFIKQPFGVFSDH